MPKGASPKREHEYQELEHKFKQEGRYPGREEEVAARIVNKQRAEEGETKEPAKQEQPRARQSRHPSRRLSSTRRNKQS